MTVPDPHSLRRRVLLVGILAFALYIAMAWTIYQLGVSDAWLLIGAVLAYLVVIRPLMRPVREAVKLRRRLAYQAWLNEKGEQ
jgi:nitric oxide reductase large subunit